MGLDSVELVLKVEDTLRIRLRDEDAEKIRAVGELFDCIMSHLEGHEQGCLSSFAFYRLRGGLMSVRGLARNDIRLSSEVAKFFPEQQRRAAWSDLQAALGLRLPELVRPAAVTNIATAIGFAIIAATSAFTLAATASMVAAAAVFFARVWAVCHILNRATEPFAVALQPEFATVRGLTNSVLHRNYRVVSDQVQRVRRRRSLGDASHHYCGPTWRAAG